MNDRAYLENARKLLRISDERVTRLSGKVDELEARLAEANEWKLKAERRLAETMSVDYLALQQRAEEAQARAEAAVELATNLRAELDATRLRANTLEDFNDEWEGRAEEAQAEVVRLTNVLTRIRDERGVKPYYVARKALTDDAEQPEESEKHNG